MNSTIHITGPRRAVYRLGSPMYVYEGRVLLATLDPVRVHKNGTELHIDDFLPTRPVLEERRPIGRWMFFELCAFVAEHHPQIQAIRFAFSRPLGAPGRPAEHAAGRALAVERVGAVDIKVEQLASGAHEVSGIWPYSERNLAALKTALEEQRAIFRKHPIAGVSDRALAALRGWLQRRAGKGH